MAAWNRKEQALGSVLPGLLEDKGWKKKFDQYSFFPCWEKVVGAEIAACTAPVKIVRDVLWLEVENSTWMQQLQFEKLQILEKVNRTLQYSRLRDVKFQLAREKKEVEKPSSAGIRFVPVDERRLKEFEAQADCVGDDAIRDALVHLWYLAHACQREKPEEE